MFCLVLIQVSRPDTLMLSPPISSRWGFSIKFTVPIADLENLKKSQGIELVLCLASITLGTHMQSLVKFPLKVFELETAGDKRIRPAEEGRGEISANAEVFRRLWRKM